MAKLRTLRHTTLELLEKPIIMSQHRPYLGMSAIGHSCTRYLWYSFRWAYISEYPARVARLFHRGHREEPVMIKELENLGYKVFGQEEGCTAGFGHIKGHKDGTVSGVIEAPKTDHLLELKTMNDRNFKNVCKVGVKSSKPVYYGQMELYMHYFKLTRALFMCVNKNDDAYYLERVKYDRDTAFVLIKRGEGVILSEVPPPKPFKPTWYECRWCAAKDICHNGRPMEENCRTCNCAEPGNDGKWYCNDVDISEASQRIGCTKYEAIE